MTKVFVLSAVLGLSALGMACGNEPAANNKNGNTNVKPATPTTTAPATPATTAPATPATTAPATSSTMKPADTKPATPAAPAKSTK